MTADNIIRIGVAVIVLDHQNKIIMGQRKGSHQSGTWALIGGYIEFGESFEQAARREAMEELGIELRDLQFLTATTYFFDDSAKHHVSIYMIARLGEGQAPTICEPHKMTALDAFDWINLPQPTFVPYHDAVTMKMIEAYKGRF